jgi:hypothetical protein
VKRGLLLALLGWPALAAAWEEEPALGVHRRAQPAAPGPARGRGVLPAAHFDAAGAGTHLGVRAGSNSHFGDESLRGCPKTPLKLLLAMIGNVSSEQTIWPVCFDL